MKVFGLVRRVVSSDHGQAVVETAAIMIPIASLFLLVTDGGLFFYGYVSAAHSVREGARCGVVGGSDANVIARVKSNFPGAVPTVTVTRTDSNADDVITFGDKVTVSATWTYTWVTPLASFGLSPTTTKTYSTAMRLESSTFTKACG